MTEAAASAAVRALLRASGIDPDDSRLAQTPRRVAQAFAELFSGVGLDEQAPLRGGTPVPPGLDFVSLRGLEFRSTCAHHLLPFSGTVHIVYIPVERLVGIGSLVRSLEILSTRPQLQEELSQQLADTVCSGAGASGALVVIEARHSCIADRGPREATSSMVTIATSGTLRQPGARASALLALRNIVDTR